MEPEPPPLTLGITMTDKTLRAQAFGHWRAFPVAEDGILATEALPNRQEYWRPPSETSSADVSTVACRHCGAEFVPGAGFCHVCGLTRSAPAALPVHWTQYFELQYLQRAWGLSTPALVACCVGAICVLGALMVGIISSNDSVRQWEDIQLARVEWLLGAGVSFVVANLLKRP